MSKKETDEVLFLHRLCLGSVELIKDKRSPKGLFYYMDKNKEFVFWDRRKYPFKEKRFDTVNELIAYVKKKFENKD